MKITVKKLKELIRESLSGFDVSVFKDMHSGQMEDYILDHNLKMLGQGFGRTVFLLSSKKVLKLATGQGGEEQNHNEFNMFSQNPELHPWLTKVYDFAGNYLKDDGYWIIEELVRAFNDTSEAEEALGLKPHTYYDGIELVENEEPNMEEAVARISLGDPNKALHWLEGVKKFYEAGLAQPDVNVHEHWGKTADGRIVLLDYGTPDDINEMMTGYLPRGGHGNLTRAHDEPEEDEDIIEED